MLNINNDVVSDIIPADYVVSSILLVAKKTFDDSLLLEQKLNPKVGKVYNCVSSPNNPINWSKCLINVT